MPCALYCFNFTCHLLPINVTNMFGSNCIHSVRLLVMILPKNRHGKSGIPKLEILVYHFFSNVTHIHTCVHIILYLYSFYHRYHLITARLLFFFHSDFVTYMTMRGDTLNAFFLQANVRFISICYVSGRVEPIT